MISFNIGIIGEKSTTFDKFVDIYHRVHGIGGPQRNPQIAEERLIQAYELRPDRVSY